MSNYHIAAVRNGVPYTKIRHKGGEIIMDASAAIKRALRCTLHDVPEEVDLLLDRLRVYDGETPVGTFIATTAPHTTSATGAVTYAIEAYDLTYLLQRNGVEKQTDAYWPAGTLYTEAVKQILVRCGISEWIIKESPLAMSTDRSNWDPGTSWLEIANQLLQEIGYNTVWFDSNGTVRIEPYVAPELRSIAHSYQQGPDSTILLQHEGQDDTFGAANVFTVLVDNPDLEEPIWVQSINDDPTSRLSVARRGRIVAPPVKLDGIANRAAAQAYCNDLKRRSMISTETATIQTKPESGHEFLDILEVDLPGLTGKWEEIEWELPLDGLGLMSHKIRRAIYV